MSEEVKKQPEVPKAPEPTVKPPLVTTVQQVDPAPKIVGQPPVVTTQEQKDKIGVAKQADMPPRPVGIPKPQPKNVPTANKNVIAIVGGKQVTASHDGENWKVDGKVIEAKLITGWFYPPPGKASLPTKVN